MSQDYHQHNLRGRSFRGQDLTGANFAGADIRGADFTGACLLDANFHQAQAGLSPLAQLRLWGILLFLAVLSGLLSAYAGATLGHLLASPNPSTLMLGVVMVAFLMLFGTVTLYSGVGVALALSSLIAATVIVIIVAITPSGDVAGQAVLSSLSLGGALAGTIGGAIVLSLACSTLGGLALLGLGLLLGSPLSIAEEDPIATTIGLVVLSLIMLWFAYDLAQKAKAGDRRYRLIHTLSLHLSTVGGTRFNQANLTNANFTAAYLPSTDFREARLTRVCWLGARLDRANLERTVLEQSAIRQLLTTGNGRGKTYDRLDLRGMNLAGANLSDASLMGTDLSQSNLQGSDLSRAKLAQAQLYGADLAGACLTGAYIQNWGIAPDTNLVGVQCDYIYMHLPTEQDPDPGRKPDNRQETFREGDFADFIAPIIRTLDSYQQQNLDPRTLTIVPKTLDLYYHEGIDPSAAAIALQQLMEQHPEANIEVLAIEGRGRQKVRLQAQVANTANPSQLNADYFDHYNQLKSLTYPDLQKLLASIEEKDARIRSLETIVMQAVGSNKFYIETYHQGDLIMSQSKGNVNISGVQGNVSGVAAAGENQTMTGVAIGAISGSVTNTISQLPASPDPDQPGIKELLTQLQAAIEAEATLSNEDKAEALEQVQTLAEAGKKPEDGVLQKAAKTAMKILKGTIASLPDAAKLAESCVKLLPLIGKLLLLA